MDLIVFLAQVLQSIRSSKNEIGPLEKRYLPQLLLNNIATRYENRHTNKDNEIRALRAKAKFFFTEIAKVKIFDADHSTELVNDAHFE